VFLTEVLAGFVKISSSTLEPDLHTSGDYSKTRATQPCSPSSSAPASGSSGHVGNRSPARARELVALRRACGLRSAFPGRARCWMGSTMVDPLLGGTGDSACPPRAAVSGGIRHCSLPAAALGFLCFNFFVHSFVSTVDHSLSFCNAQMFMDLFGVWSRLGQFIWCPCNSCGLYLENCFKSDLFLT
jgi:hypothetical protein